MCVCKCYICMSVYYSKNPYKTKKDKRIKKNPLICWFNKLLFMQASRSGPYRIEL